MMCVTSSASQEEKWEAAVGGPRGRRGNLCVQSALVSKVIARRRGDGGGVGLTCAHDRRGGKLEKK